MPIRYDERRKEKKEGPEVAEALDPCVTSCLTIHVGCTYSLFLERSPRLTPRFLQ